MNKIFLISSLIAISLFSCQPDDAGYTEHQTKATIYFINETADWIRSDKSCERDILPGDTVKIEFDGLIGTVNSSLDINTFPTTAFICSKMKYQDGNVLKCENKVDDIKKFENRKEITPWVFEFTFLGLRKKKS